MPNQPTLIPDMTNRAYHGHQALGSTSLKTLATRTPAHYKPEQKNPKTPDVFNIGTAAHSLILEDDTSQFVVVDAANWLTKDAKSAKAEALAGGLVPLLTKEFEQVKAMRDSVMRDERALVALTGHKAEQSVFWEEDDLALKCRPDAWQPGKLWDLKTTINADPNEFGKTAHNYGYHQSNAHYVDGVKALTGEELPFCFILVEKTAPYLVSVVELDWEAVNLGRALNDRAKRIYRECAATNTWPGYAPAEPVSLPMWAVYESEDLLGIPRDVEVEI